MTRKDYEALAQAFGEAFAAADSVQGLRAQVLARVKNVLAADNDRFDRDRFDARVFVVETALRG